MMSESNQEIRQASNKRKSEQEISEILHMEESQQNKKKNIQDTEQQLIDNGNLLQNNSASNQSNDRAIDQEEQPSQIEKDKQEAKINNELGQQKQKKCEKNSDNTDDDEYITSSEKDSESQDINTFVTKTYGDFLTKNEVEDEVSNCIKLAKEKLENKAKMSQEKAKKMKKKYPKLFCMIHKKLYETEEKYTQHTIKHHPDIAQQENLTQFKCLKCLKVFITYGWWEKHVINCQGLRQKLAQLSNSDKKLFLLGLSMKNSQ